MAKVHALATFQKHLDHKANKKHDCHRPQNQSGSEVGFLLIGRHSGFVYLD